MKNTYITIAVVIIILIGIFAILKSRKLEAPTNTNDTANMEDMDMSGDATPEESDSTSTQNNPPSSGLNVGVGAGVTATTGGVKEFTVIGDNFSFVPSAITVKKGDKVKITFKNTEGFHNFVIDEFGVATKSVQAPDTEVLEFTADKTGTFQYYCAVGSHRAMGMWGTLKVE